MQLPESEVRFHKKITGIKSFQQSQRTAIVYSPNTSIFATSCFGFGVDAFRFRTSVCRVDTDHSHL